MRLLFRLLLIALLCLPLLLGVALWLAVGPTPVVPPADHVTAADIGRAVDLLHRNDPRGQKPGVTRAVILSQRDLELLAAQAGKRYGQARSRVRLQPGLARIQVSLPLPANPLGMWLNIEAVLRETTELPTVDRFRLGRLRVPGWLAENAVPPLLAALNLRNQGELAQRMVRRVGFGPQQLVLAYALPNGLRHDLRETLLPAAEQARLKAYADHLSTLINLLAARQSKVSMAQLIPPTFQLASQRSSDRASAEAENRAALVALAFLVNRQSLATLAPGATPWPRKPALRVVLAQREDTPLHFLVSAALAVTGGGPLADAIGLYKEVADSKGGSGFSFNDLAADRAGTRFGQQALRDPQGFQARLAAMRLDESDLLPAIADLPESMSAEEFARRFGGVGAPPYQRMLADIESRLDKLTLLKPRP